MAIEEENIENIQQSLITSGGMNPEQIKITKGDCKKNSFYCFDLIADLYIWTSKYWYGTLDEKLIYVRLKNVTEVPILFLLKYGPNIRLAIRSKYAYVVKDADAELLDQARTESLAYFNEERIKKIKPFMKKLEKKWQLLISNNNPYS